MSRSTSMTRKALAAVFAVTLVLAGNVVAGSDPMIRPAQLSSTERVELEELMAEQIQITLQEMKPLEGQLFPAKVVVRFDSEEILLVEMGRRFVIKPDGTTLSDVDVLDQLHMITSTTAAMNLEVGFRGVEYSFEGKSIVYYYPELRKRTKKATGSQQDSAYPPFPPYVPPPVYGDPDRMYVPPQPYPIATLPSIAINPGHGLYKLYDAGTLNPNYRWTTQRDRSNGVLEDEITPVYAAELKQWLIERSSGVDTFFTRSTSSQVHTQSTQESGNPHLWSDMGAKYHVEQQYPERTDLWDVTSRTDNQRDRAKDINSRSLFADEVGALAMISLHTNAAPDTAALTARGTQVFFDKGEAADQALASSIVCYMKELVTAQPGYQNWTMRETVASDEYAENFGSMPSALVEIAFHTNPDDAIALQDSRFRTASMKGVEKGYRMWREGRQCAPLAIASVTDSTAPNGGGKAESALHFNGYPAFPVTLKVTIVKCPVGSSCTNGDSTYAESKASPLTWTFGCNAKASSPTATIRVQSQLIDADGVTSNPVESNVVCTTATASNATSQTSSAPMAAHAQ